MLNVKVRRILQKHLFHGEIFYLLKLKILMFQKQRWLSGSYMIY